LEALEGVARPGAAVSATSHAVEKPGPACPRCGKTMDLDDIRGDVARWSCRCATMTIVPCPKCTEGMAWPDGADAPGVYDICDECEAHVNCVSIADSNEAIEIVQRERDEARAEVARLKTALESIASMTWPKTMASKGDALSDAIDVAR